MSSRTEAMHMLTLVLATAFAARAAAAPDVLPKPGQPTKSGTPGSFEIVGDSGVSAMQLFLGQDNRVYIVDKTENNPPKVGSHIRKLVPRLKFL
ncbi:hypothetical protein CTheo_9255 [Ceratobasidium theobromae]|uniref:Effector protein n=1 Tax=Ceratobasidium theobromae TaxID=1582974 RepID=A0A5N5Q7D2_9AGAM|nr:hypothetical protein CTheo_9255 [Ceratobasidium theobromae]